MKTDTITIKVRKLMDILDANITVSGVTVITPGMDSDRQLLLKFIYYLLYHIIHYQRDVEKKLFNEDGLDKTYQHLRRIVKTFDPEENPIIYIGNEEYLYTLEREQEWIAAINRIEKLLPPDTQNSEEHNNLFKQLRDIVTQQFSDAKKTLRERPVSFLMQNLFGIHPEKWELPNFEVWENENPIITPQQKHVHPFKNLRKVIYLCPPLFPSSKDRMLAAKWYQFSLLLQQEMNNADNREIHKKIREQMKGEVIAVSSTRFIYKREDGKEMNISKCNQQIKILATFERLSYYGLLDEQTLIIMETPEDKLTLVGLQNLGELIFELNKELGVRFILGTNNPKLITILQTISKTQNKEDILNIYYAREKEEPYKYTFVTG